MLQYMIGPKYLKNSVTNLPNLIFFYPQLLTLNYFVSFYYCRLNLHKEPEALRRE